MYKEKTIQLIHFFANENGGSIETNKLMLLLYLSDCLSIEATGYPISYDDYFSLENQIILFESQKIIEEYDDILFSKVFKDTHKNNKILYLKNENLVINNVSENTCFDLMSIQDWKTIKTVLTKFKFKNHLIEIFKKLIHSENNSQITIEKILKQLKYSDLEIIEHSKEIYYFKKIYSK